MSDVLVELVTGAVTVEVEPSAGVEVVTLPTATPLVEVEVLAVPGPPGLDAYVHQQPVPLSEWIVNHNTGVRRGASVFSVGGAEIEADVFAVSENQTRITFVLPTAGFARLL